MYRSLQPPVSSDTIISQSENTASPENYTHTFTIESIADEHHQADEDEETEKPKSDTGSVKGSQLLAEGETDTSTAAAEPSDASEHSNGEVSESPSPDIPKKKKKFRSLDPITWYGILVPPSLRSAQKSFTETVDGQLPELASVAVEMRAVEKEVERVRQELGEK